MEKFCISPKIRKRLLNQCRSAQNIFGYNFEVYLVYILAKRKGLSMEMLRLLKNGKHSVVALQIKM
ncbi:hypothetical protein MMC2321_02830 [Chitinophaga sp. MM2321]